MGLLQGQSHGYKSSWYLTTDDIFTNTTLHSTIAITLSIIFTLYRMPHSYQQALLSCPSSTPHQSVRAQMVPLHSVQPQPYTRLTRQPSTSSLPTSLNSRPGQWRVVSCPARHPAPTGRLLPQLPTNDPCRHIGSSSHWQSLPYYINSRGGTPVPPSFHNQLSNQSATPASSLSTYGPRSAIWTHYQPNPTPHPHCLNPLPPNILTMMVTLLNSDGAIIHYMTA
jgi:hypothetical protein